MVNCCDIDLFCPTCAERRRYHRIQAHLPQIRYFIENHPDLIPYSVTLTIPGAHDLCALLKELADVRKQFIDRSKRSARGARPTWFCPIAHGITCIEIARNLVTGEWHPHIHALMFAKQKLTTSHVRRCWTHCGGGVQVKVTTVTGHKCKDPGPRKKKLTENSQRVFRYAIKFSEMSLKDRVEAWWLCRHRGSGLKLFVTFGEFRGGKHGAEENRKRESDVTGPVKKFRRRDGKYRRQRDK